MADTYGIPTVYVTRERQRRLEQEVETMMMLWFGHYTDSGLEYNVDSLLKEIEAIAPTLGRYLWEPETAEGFETLMQMPRGLTMQRVARYIAARRMLSIREVHGEVLGVHLHAMRHRRRVCIVQNGLEIAYEWFHNTTDAGRAVKMFNAAISNAIADLRYQRDQKLSDAEAAERGELE